MSAAAAVHSRFIQYYLSLDGTEEQVRERVAEALLLALNSEPSPQEEQLSVDYGPNIPVPDSDLSATGALSLGDWPALPEHGPELHTALLRAMGPQAAYVCVYR